MDWGAGYPCCGGQFISSSSHLKSTMKQYMYKYAELHHFIVFASYVAYTEPDLGSTLVLHTWLAFFHCYDLQYFNNETIHVHVHVQAC